MKFQTEWSQNQVNLSVLLLFGLTVSLGLLEPCECSTGTSDKGDNEVVAEAKRHNSYNHDNWKNKRRLCLGLDDNLKDYTHPGGIQPHVEETGLGEPELTDMVCGEDSQFCYALWKYGENGTMVFMKQGCWGASQNNACMNKKCIQNLPKSQMNQPQSQGHGQSVTTAQPKDVGADAQGTTLSTNTASGSGEQSQNQNQNLNQQKPYFCCCDSDYCNENVEIQYVDVSESEEDSDEEFGGEYGARSKRNSLPVVLILCGGILGGLLILFVGYRYWRRLALRYRKGAGGAGRGEECGDGGEDGMSLGGSGQEGKLLLLGGEEVAGDDRNIIDGIQLVVLLARGKFASVYEGKIPSLADGPFALKCFNREQKEFFENERFVFNYLGKHCNHENIIKYYGWQEFTVGPTTHLILVLDKICPGNLREYLQAITGAGVSRSDDENENYMKIVDVLRICSGIASGLSYLHGENRDEIVIAHRDLTSKNILIDGETLTAKITDFGLSLVTRGSKYYWAGRERQAEFCSLAEAGTLRYMAPELLEGAVNLKDCENALKQADVYALALIIWEVANCSKDVRLTRLPPQTNQTQNQSQNDESTNTGSGGEEQILTVEHSLPYEEEIGKDNFSMDLLSRHVVQYRNRPHFRRWKDTPYTRQLRDTLVESWDAEPDARLTALCIVERLLDIKNIRMKNNSDLLPGVISTNSVPQTALQTPLESPGQGGIYGEVIDSPWTGRNPCLQRNLLTVTATSTTSGGGGVGGVMGMGGVGGMSTSGSGLSESNSLIEGHGHHHPHHHQLRYDFSKNQANFYHNYVGGSSGGTSYSTSSTTSAGGNNTEMSNVSSIGDDNVTARNQLPGQIIETRFQGQGQGQPAHGTTTPSNGPPPLPPTIPFVQNLHA